MTWYLLLVSCALFIQSSMAAGSFLAGWIEGASTEGTEPTHGGIVLLAYRLGHRARLRREARIRTAITPKGRR